MRLAVAEVDFVGVVELVVLVLLHSRHSHLSVALLTPVRRLLDAGLRVVNVRYVVFIISLGLLHRSCITVWTMVIWISHSVMVDVLDD